MQIMPTIAIIVTTIAGISAVIGIFYANARNKLATTTTLNYEKTIASYKEIVGAQEIKIDGLMTETKELRKLHTESVKMIGQLQGELQSWKQLPIRELADNMAYISEIQYIMAKHLGIDHLPELSIKNPGNG